MKNPNRLPFGLVLLALIIAGVGGILAAALIIAAERKPTPAPEATTDTIAIPHRVIRAHADSIDVRYAIQDINNAKK